MEEGFRQLAIATSQNYPTQYSEELPGELIGYPAIRQLDSLTLCNFKSFRRQHYVGPFLRFTSVVGPNGSGKSNILEALFFCICGDRQKGHRGDPKVELLFTQELICKTEGETLLQFNREQQECWVQTRFLLASGEYLLARRQLLLNGESRYTINGREYPQKIYQQYLSSQGLLSDVCNFAIFQGQTDRMAAIEPKDLRHYLETLSGSVRLKECYDTDKSQLERLDRLIEENTGRVTRLKQEKRNIKQILSTTSDYDKLTNKLNECVEAQFAAKLLFREIDIRKLQRQLHNKTEQEAKEQQELAQKKAQMQRDYKESGELQVKLNELQEQRSGLVAKLKLCNSHQSVIKQRELSELQAQLRADREEQELLTARTANLQKSMPTVALPEQLNEYLALYQQWEKENFLLKSEVEKKQLNIAALERSITAKEQALLKMKDARKKGEQDEASKHRKIEELTSQLADVRSANKRIKETISKANDDSRRTADLITGHERSISSVNHNLQQLENRLLEGLEENKLRDLFKKLMTVQGFKGRIADKIKPVNKKYAQCFGQLMAATENNLLVESEQAAKDLAAKLKDLCTIKNVVILSNVNDREQNVAAFRRELGKHGIPAIDVVDFDRDLTGLEGYLMLALKGKVICDSLDEGFRLRELNLKSVKEIYTLDGSVLRDDGMISLSGEPSSHKKTYRFDVDGQKKLEREMAALQKEKQTLEQEIKKLKERVLSTTQLSGLMAELNGLERKEQEILTEIEHWKKYKARSSNDHDFLETELKELRLKREKLREVLTKVEANMADSSFFAGFMRKHNIRDLSAFRSGQDMKDVEANYQLRNRINSEVEAIKKRVEQLGRKGLPAKIDRLQEELRKVGHAGYRKELEDELGAKERDIKQLKQRLDQLHVNFEHVRFKSEVPELIERLRFLEIQKELAQRELAQAEGLNTLSPDFDKLLQLLKEDFNSVRREQVETLLTKLESERKGIENEMEKFNSLAFFGTGGTEIDTVEQRVKQLEESLDASIEARDQVKQRLATTALERTRILVNFIERLKLVLADSYRTLTEASDSKVYGHADLFLENQDQPFLGGIYYSPTPPSKRFVYDVDQLSGGQKSLASIALQFSAAVTSRAPFVMFDESDAFLDTHNVHKLVNLIAKGMEGTPMVSVENGLQFIVVSHKPMVFASGDSLIGAMNRERSSRVYSLRLSS